MMSKKNIITIHQPDFMPWHGLFNKINNADIWVVLNHVKNNPRDANFWCRRVKILINKEPQWLSIPLCKPKNKEEIGIPINKIEINRSLKTQLQKTLKTIEQNYKKHPFFLDVFPLIEEYFISEEAILQIRNMNFIIKVLEKLEIKTKIIYSSDLSCKSHSTELLIEIMKKLNGDEYLAGAGASGYQKDDLFKNNNITLAFNNFKQPKYKQYKSDNFIPGLSIIDQLMNIGFEKFKSSV
jgi:hypothetical protein